MEIKLTSITAISGISPNISAVMWRALVRSMTVTLGSFRNFQSSCPYPTSIEYTCFAPFRRQISVNPPVLAPISITTRPFRSALKTRTAFSSLCAPRLTNLSVSPRIVISSSGFTVSEDLLIFLSPIYTSPAMIIACAFSRLCARPRRTRAVSARSFPLNAFSSRGLLGFCRGSFPVKVRLLPAGGHGFRAE